MAKTSWKKGIPLEEPLQERLRRLVREHGEDEVAKKLELGVISILRAAAGVGLRRGTAYVIKSRLGALEKVA